MRPAHRQHQHCLAVQQPLTADLQFQLPQVDSGCVFGTEHEHSRQGRGRCGAFGRSDEPLPLRGQSGPVHILLDMLTNTRVVIDQAEHLQNDRLQFGVRGAQNTVAGVHLSC